MVNLIMTHFIYFKFQVHTLTDFRDIKININFKKGEMVQKILKENNQDKKVQDKVIPIYCPHPPHYVWWGYNNFNSSKSNEMTKTSSTW